MIACVPIGLLGAALTDAGDPVRFETIGIREDILIKTIIEPAGEGIITGHSIPPLN